MKKLITLAMAVAMAGMVGAATCTWGSGAIRTASSAEGGWSGTTVNAAGVLVTMNLYKIDSTTYDSLSKATQESLYKDYSGKTANLTGQNKNGTTIIGAITINETAETAVAGVDYAVAIATYTDANYGDMYIATTVKTGYNAATSKGSATGIIQGVGNWQVASTTPPPVTPDVPEPTSGLLLLMGMAGLALRRKHA